MEAIVAGLAAPVAALFQYNRGNFMYDRGQDLTKKFQAYTFKVNQFGLYREDVRDLVALTLDKTSNYQIVVALELGFIIALIGPARLRPGTPSWITWLTFASLCESVIYLTLGLWFASHASISAASYGARLLTQFVRLPVPSDEQLTTAVTRANDFEGADFKRMLRMPFLKAAYKKIWTKGDVDETLEEDVKEIVTAEEHEQLLVPLLTHIRLLRKLQQYWINFDAYSRISLAIGTYSMLKALCFYSLGYYVHEMKNFYAGFLGVIIFSSLAVLLMTLDMLLTPAETTLAGVLFFLPTMLATLAMGLQYGLVEEWRETVVSILIPFMHGSAAAFMLWILKKAAPERCDDGSFMPMNFRLVHFLDMFKNFRGDHTAKAIEALDHEERQDLDPVLAKRQAEEALLGAMDEWKGTKSTSCVMRLLMLSLELANVADLPADHALVLHAKLHLQELKIIDAIQKEKRILQMLQSPTFFKLLPHTTQQSIEHLYLSLSNLAGIPTDVSQLPGGVNTDDAWFHVDDTHADYYLSLSEPHRREPHPASNAVVVSLRMIQDDITLLKKNQHEVDKLLNDIQEPSLQTHLTSTRKSKKKPRWYRDDAASNIVEIEEPLSTMRAETIPDCHPDKYSVGHMLNELGSAFSPKSLALGNNIDEQRMIAALFPWHMFRMGTFISVAVWVLMGVIRCFTIYPEFRNAMLFVEFRGNQTVPENTGRRLLQAWDVEIFPHVNQTFFDPSTLACTRGRAIVGNSYMAYNATDESPVCWHEHEDLTYVENRLMALSVDGTRLLDCDTDERRLEYALDIAVRRFDVSMSFAVGIRKEGNDVLLFQRNDIGFRAVASLSKASLSKEPATAVSITESHVYALLESTILAWRIGDAIPPSAPTIIPFVANQEVVGICVTKTETQDDIYVLQREYIDDIIMTTRMKRLRI